MTGKKPGKSTLSVRYLRLKANISSVAPEHIQQMLQSEAKVTEDIQAEIKDLWGKKWARIGKHMEDAGAQSYPVCPHIIYLSCDHY
jgi:hypothetical protein